MIARHLLSACLGAVLLHGAARAADRLAVCIDKASVTAARDHKLAEEVGRQENVPVSFASFDSSEADDGVTVKEFKKLLATQCDFVMGFPVDTGEPDAPPGLMQTRAYAQTGFVLAVPAGSAAKSLADFPAGTPVAVTFETAPQLYFLTHTNVKPSVQTTEDATLQALVDGKAQAAILWQPTIEAWLGNHDAKYTLYPIHEPHARFDVVALYMPRSSGDAQRFDAAVAKIAGGTAAGGTAAGGTETSGKAAADGAAPPASRQSGTDFDPAMVRLIGFDNAGGPGAPPAIYTEAQQTAGAKKFAAICAVCHGAQLQGLAGPTLKGPNFASVKAAFAVSDIFAIVSQNMPASAPGSLQPDDYVEIMAFLLNQNGYPAGSTALTFDEASKSTVPFVYRGK
jgi:polar amino acid transport system substrate-binding protein